ncbi:MAG: type II secretion system F family protein [Alphaproteobacteria bacterium]
MALMVLLSGALLFALTGAAVIFHAQVGAQRMAALDKRLTRIALDRDRYAHARQHLPLAERLMTLLPHFLITRLARADIDARPPAVIGAIGAFICAIASAFIFGGMMVGVALGAIMTGLALLGLEAVAARRLDEFVDALPGFFDRVRQLVATGNTLQQALERANDNAPQAINRFVDPVINRLHHGAAITDSIDLMAERLDVAELSMFATAVETNMRYGGRLSDVLENLVNLLRDRTRIGRELRSATSETRTSTMILIALPLLVGGLIVVINPGYVSFFITDPMGRTLMTFAALLEITGLILARRLSNVNY